MRVRTCNPTEIGAVSGPYAGEKKAHLLGGGLAGVLGGCLSGRQQRA